LKAGGDEGTAKRSSRLNWPRAGRWRRAGRERYAGGRDWRGHGRKEDRVQVEPEQHIDDSELHDAGLKVAGAADHGVRPRLFGNAIFLVPERSSYRA
jgi:hypothetical protein